MSPAQRFSRLTRAKLREVAESASRRIVLTRRLPAHLGGDSILVSPSSMLRLWWPNLERADSDLFRWASEFVRKGSTVWDVGANIGLFTFAAAYVAGPTGHVLAIEADTWMVDLLRRSGRNSATARAPIEFLPVAVTDSIGISRFNVARRGRASSFVEGVAYQSQAGGVRETHLVMTVTLDWLLERFPAPDIIKIDVEGAEAQVLAGAARLLQETRPVILCEVGQQNSEAVRALLFSSGYRLYNLADSGDRSEQQHPAFNTLAVPIISE